MDTPECAVPVPATEIVVHRAAWRQVFRQRRPLAASAQDEHHPVDDIPLGYRSLVATALGRRDQRADQRPLLVGQVAWIAQFAPIIVNAVLVSPHRTPPANR